MTRQDLDANWQEVLLDALTGPGIEIPAADLLTGANDGSWLSRCAAAVRSGSLSQADTLDSLLNEGQEIGEALRYEKFWTTARDKAEDPPRISAAKAVLGVAYAALDPKVARVRLGPAEAHWQRACVLPEATATHEYTKLIEMALKGGLPDPTSRVHAAVVFGGRSDGEPGESATLTVAVQPGGPPGLFPDPRSMTFLAADPGFADSLAVAWHTAPVSVRHRCVIWDIFKEEKPFRKLPEIAGGSLGAAFGVALHDLARAARPLGAARVRRLDPSCAITGRLQPDGRLLPVTNYEEKFLAASRQKWRVVAPADDPQAVKHAGLLKKVDYARDLTEAIRKSRLFRILPHGVIALIVVLVLAAGGASATTLAVQGQEHAAAAAATAARLTSTANGLRSTDPAVAAQLDVAAYDATPSPNGYTAMLNDEDAPLESVVSATASALALSPDGDLLATVWGTGAVSLQDAADPAQAAVSLSGTGGQSGTSSDPVGFSLDGRMLAAPVPAGGISLWNVAAPGHAVKSSPDFGSKVTAVAFSPSGNIIATGTQQDTVQLWNIANPARPAPLGQPASASGSSGGPVTSLMFSSNGQSLYSGTVTGTIEVLSTGTSGSLELASQPVSGAQGQQDQVTFSQNGQAVVADESGDTFLYNLIDQGAPQSINGGPAVISPSGLTIAARDQAGDITLLNTTQPLDYPLGAQLPVQTPTEEGSQSPGPMSFDADGTVLAAGDNGTVILWHLPVGYQADAALPLAALLEPDSIDGNSAAVAVQNNVFVQQLSGARTITYQVGGTMTGLLEAIPALGDDGHLLAVGEKNGSVSLWSLSSGKATLVDQPITSGVTSLSLSADGKLLAASATDGSASLWDLADPTHQARLAGPFGYGDVVALSPDGGTLAVSTGTGIQLWNLDDPRHPAMSTEFSLGKGNPQVTALALSPGGTTLAVGTVAGNVRLWNLGSAPASYGQPLTSNYDSDYNYLQTRVSSIGVNALAFSADGKTLTSINADSTIRAWDLQPATAISDICAATAEAVTTAVWNQYFPNDPYEAPCRNDATAARPAQATTAPRPSSAQSGQSGQSGQASLCTASDLRLSSHVVSTSNSQVIQNILILILTNKSRSSCSLTGVPSVGLVGSPDPTLGNTYRVVSNAQPDQPAVTLAPGTQAHVNLTYLAASQGGVPSGGGNPGWVPQTVTMTLPGTNATLTIPWPLKVGVVRQDDASTTGTFSGPFIAGSGPAT